MSVGIRKQSWLRAILLSLGLTAATALPASGQSYIVLPHGGHGTVCPPATVVTPSTTTPSTTTPSTTTPSTPDVTTPSTTGMDAPGLSAGATAMGGAGFGMAAGAGGTYIDYAIPRTMARLRYDSAYDNVRPDRAEFFYAKCGCFGTPDANGPPLPETSVDYQDVMLYLEYAPSCCYSAFVELPYRMLNPEVNANASGYADMNFGVKYAVLCDPCQYLTAQLKIYAPTGDASEGLGTDHFSIEPAALFWQRLDQQIEVFGEFRAWFPIDGSDFAGEVLRYGVGAFYNMNTCGGSTYYGPVVEAVGWTVLSGQQLVVVNPDPLAATVQDAGGTTIVNMKVSFRAGNERGDFAIGYGRALTGPTWYEDIFRAEFRLFF